MPETTDHPALALWRELIEAPYFTPLTEDPDGVFACYFCCNSSMTFGNDDGHTHDCIYLRARALVEATPAPAPSATGARDNSPG